MRHPIVVCLFATAMGTLEAAVVVYLRRIYYPGGFGFPLAPMEPAILRTEILREAMTMVMLASVAWLAGKSAWPRLMAFLLAFGVWDLAYYAGLKVLIGWPASLLAPDILFLIPAPWVGPVLAPVLVAGAWVAGGLVLHRARYADLRVGWGPWVAGATGAGIVLASFLLTPAGEARPRFPWAIFVFGYALGVLALAVIFVRSRRSAPGDAQWKSGQGTGPHPLLPGRIARALRVRVASSSPRQWEGDPPSR